MPSYTTLHLVSLVAVFSGKWADWFDADRFLAHLSGAEVVVLVQFVWLVWSRRRGDWRVTAREDWNNFCITTDSICSVIPLTRDYGA